MFWIIHHGCILPTPSTIIIFFIGWRGESSICVVPRHSIEQQNLCLYHLHDGLEYKKHFFLPSPSRAALLITFFSCVYMNTSWRQKAEKNSILFSPTSSIFYLPHGSQMKIQEKKKTRTEENGSFFVFSLVLFLFILLY